jgi:hypothetical protein
MSSVIPSEMTPGQDREFRNEQQQQPVILSEVGGWE